MNKRISFFFLMLCLMTGIAQAQVSITNSTPYTQNFDGLPSTGAPTSTNPNPANWYRYAATTGATALTVGNGSSNTGGFYSAGDTATASRSDRALGSLLSSGSKPLYFGVKFVNNTGSTIVSATVSYSCEQWRRGNNNAGLKDTLLFEYSTNADSVQLGTWTGVPGLTGSSVNSSTTTGALNGNTNSSLVSGNITGLAIPNGATFWIRYNDFDVSPGSDDLLAVDDFSISFTTGSVAACAEPANSVTNVVLSATGTTSVSGSFTGTTPAADGYLVLLDSTATVPTIVDATTYTVGQSVGTAVVVSNGTSTTFNKSGLVANTIYHAYVYPYNNTSCSGGPNYKTSAPGNDTAKTLVDACPEPTAKPTNLVFTAVTTNSITGKFNKAVPAPNGYVVVYSTSSNVGYPLDSVNYSVGDSVKYSSFKSKVAYVGTDSNFSVSGLVSGTRYYFAVVPYNSCSGIPNYLRTSPLKADTVTAGTAPLSDCTAPTGVNSATIIKLDSTTSTISLKWKNSANGDSVLVFAAPFNTIGSVTIHDSAYYMVGGTVPSSGSTQPIVYYRGTDSSTTLTGLSTNTLYKIFVVAFNNKGCINGPNYGGLANVLIRTAAVASGDCTQPTGISNTSIVKLDSTVSTIRIKWTNPANADSVMILAGPTGSIGFVTIHDSTYYAVGSTVPGTGATVYYRGTDSSLTITGLISNTVYKILFVPFNNKACNNGPNYVNNPAFTTIRTAIATGVKYHNAEAEFALYPNPTSNGSLFVKFKTALREEATIEVLDILGRKLDVQQLNPGTDMQTINVSNLAKGTYLLNVVYKGTNNVSSFIVE